jgi:myo-inositol-1(or 4)-monophosphatase
MDLDELTRVARHAAEEGARVARAWQDPGVGRTVREKAGPRDLVSQADLETEAVIRRILREHRPGDTIIGEEHGSSAGHAGVTWLVDPIDGTTSYLYGRADWAVSVAALGQDGRIVSGVVAEPGHGRLTYATRGKGALVDGLPASVTSRTALGEALVEVNFGRPDQHGRAGRMVDALLPRVRDLRRGGSAAASLAGVAAGRADAVWSPGLQPWDGAAGIVLVLEAGGVVGDLDGPSDGRWPASGDVLAAPEALWEPLRRLLAEAYSTSG